MRRRSVLCLISVIFSVILISGLVWASGSGRRTQGFIYSFRGHDYLTEHLGTTYPHTQLNWKGGKRPADLCLSHQPGRCPAYVIEFSRKAIVGERGVLKDAQVIPALDDPLARAQYLRTIFTELKSASPRAKK